MGREPFCSRERFRENVEMKPMDLLTLRSQMRISFAFEEARMLASWRFHFTCVAPAKSGHLVSTPQRSMNCSLRTTKRAQTEYRFLSISQIPCPNPRVDPCADDDVTFGCVPVNISNSSVMCVEDVFDGGLAGHHEVPYQPKGGQLRNTTKRHMSARHTVSDLKLRQCILF